MTWRAAWGLIFVAVILGGCASQPEPSAYDPPGFFSALFHGFLSPVALIGSLFVDVRIYAFPNSGWWYDLGFMLGLWVFVVVAVVMGSDRSHR